MTTPEELVRLAKEARARAYVPYSGYAVGAALLCKDGAVYQGTYGHRSDAESVPGSLTPVPAPAAGVYAQTETVYPDRFDAPRGSILPAPDFPPPTGKTPTILGQAPF